MTTTTKPQRDKKERTKESNSITLAAVTNERMKKYFYSLRKIVFVDLYGKCWKMHEQNDRDENERRERRLHQIATTRSVLNQRIPTTTKDHFGSLEMVH